MEIKITRTFEVTAQNIEDLMVCALEGGINDWCDKVEVKQQPIEDWEFASEVISLTNGILELTDLDGKKHELTQDKFAKGIVKAMEWGGYSNFDDLMENHDAELVDVLIQYALFGEIVYG